SRRYKQNSKWWKGWRERGLAMREIQLPKKRPEVFLQRMHIGIAWQYGSNPFPLARVTYQSGPHGIFENIPACRRESALLAFFFAQNIVCDCFCNWYDGMPPKLRRVNSTCRYCRRKRIALIWSELSFRPIQSRWM